MRNLPPSLASHLQSGVTTTCTCWKLITSDGAVKGFTDHDNDLAFDGVNFQAATGFVGTEALSRIGLSVDNMEIHSALSSGKLEEKDLANGLYDNAEIEVYLVNWQDITQRILMRSGNIGEVKRSSLAFMAEVRGLAHHLQQPQGRLYQQTCDAELGDEKCSIDLNLPAYSIISSVVNVTPDSQIQTDNLTAFPTGWFNGGKLEWLSGENTGAITEVKSHQKFSDNLAGITLWRRHNVTPSIADQFKLTAGCDKTFGTCKAKFFNQLRFRGFPHIPGNDYIIKSPNQDDSTQDGSSQN